MRYGAGKYEVNNRMVDNNKNYENGILSVKGTKKTEIAEKERSVKRVILIVADSLGVGALPDAEKYGDEGADTLGHIMRAVPAQMERLQAQVQRWAHLREGPSSASLRKNQRARIRLRDTGKLPDSIQRYRLRHILMAFRSIL